MSEPQIYFSAPAAAGQKLVFTQTDNLGIFIMDQSQTFAEPDPPQLNSHTIFTLGGIFTQPVRMDHTEFLCEIYGQQVYDEKFPDAEEILPGSWSYALPFDIPKIAPPTTYHVTIKGIDHEQKELFTVVTEFHF